MTFASATGELFRKTLRQFPRVPPDIVQALAIPLFFFAVFSLQFKAIAQLPGFPTASYAAFLLPQILVFTSFTSANGAGYGFVLEAKSGYLDKLRAMPIPRSTIVLGRILAVALRAALQATLVLLLAWPFGLLADATLVGLAGILVLAACVSMTWAALMSALGIVTKSPEAVEASAILFIPLTYLTTGSIPLEFMDPFVQRIVLANPVTWIVEGMRALVLGGGTAFSLGIAFGTAALLALLGVSVATWAMRRMDRM